MNDLNIVAEAGLKTAIVVDDGYDPVPRASELANAEWDTLFDDLIGSAGERVKTIYEEFDRARRTTLRKDNAFIEALWNARGELGDILGDLFASYEDENKRLLRKLEPIIPTLEALGLEVKTCGRNFVDQAVEADLILIDLYLGAAQDDRDRLVTIKGLKKVLALRDTPPAIILMSQVSLTHKAPELRDEVEIHASGFRSVRKSELSKTAVLKGHVVTLATHREDSVALAAFTKTWTNGTAQALQRATKTLRKIDIDDLHHIKSLLLAEEGLLPSSYMINVLDRVLQYEIEADSKVLNEALALNSISQTAAPLMISQDKDSFALIEQAIYVNPKRRKRETGALWPITFGDILGSRLQKVADEDSIFAGNPMRVFFVASPECDLIREGGVKTALLIGGTLVPLDRSAKLYGESKTTPVLSRGKSRFQVEWDFSSPATISLDEARRHLARNGPGDILGTLRDTSALNLRQQFLHNLGRVGLMALPPRTFRVSIKCSYPLEADGFQAITMNGLSELQGTMHVDQRTKSARIAIDQVHETAFSEAVAAIDLGTVAVRSRQKVSKLQEQVYIRQIFRSGLQKLVHPLGNNVNVNLIRPLDADGEQHFESVGKFFSEEEKMTAGAALKAAGFLFTLVSEEV